MTQSPRVCETDIIVHDVNAEPPVEWNRSGPAEAEHGISMRKGYLGIRESSNMLTEYGLDVVAAAAIAALSSEIAIHPMDTMITRIQSKDYSTVYKHSNGALRRSLFTGLYQGFGPTLFAGIPSSAAFFATYDASKTAFERAQVAGYLQDVPRPILHTVSSAAAELVACALMNPAEVLKQNAQIARKPRTPSSGPSASMQTLKQFYRQPSALWAGYWVLVAGQLPSICLTFCLYESIKESLNETYEGSASLQMQTTVLSAGLAGGCSSWFFVPIDVVKTRMRLAVGSDVQVSRLSIVNSKMRGASSGATFSARLGAVAVAQEVLLREGIAGFFRGSRLTCLTATVGSAMYIGCYEGTKLFLNGA
ncbi:putative mitochondrial carrier protein (Pet8) [Aspergillus affinis]|uniref:putative mitochondrial carrier protein (Pet8) n=1 Tax=Aspergillus affinis TaxID=1070780 RepID=UPI0022FDFAF1|nr:uncharacterized protein KD926_001261 [Aspergillus affinis]KAI9036873.1 hypothetical protein KD926_001261 [Aspergillus affinis]